MEIAQGREALFVGETPVIRTHAWRRADAPRTTNDEPTNNGWVTQDTDGLLPSDNRHTHRPITKRRPNPVAHAATNLCPNPARLLLSPLPSSPSNLSRLKYLVFSK